jgi:hypothetical protein
MVRLLLVYYDHYGLIATFVSLAGCSLLMAITAIPIYKFLLSMTNLDPLDADGVMLLMVSPLAIYLCPTFWASGLLIVERMWMLFGIHRRVGWQPNHFRKIIGRMVGENK